jgi:hypothetical protein
LPAAANPPRDSGSDGTPISVERATGFETERSEVLDVKSGPRPDFSFDTRDAGETRDSFDPVKTAFC